MTRTLVIVLVQLVLLAVVHADDATFPPGDPPEWMQKRDFLVTPSQEGISAALKQRHAGRQIDGDYMVFVDGDGRIDHVEVVRSVPGCDDWIVRNMTGSHLDGLHQRMRFVRM